jgi:hypothetical protein
LCNAIKSASINAITVISMDLASWYHTYPNCYIYGSLGFWEISYNGHVLDEFVPQKNISIHKPICPPHSWDDSEGNNRLLGTLSGVGSRAGKFSCLFNPKL